MILKKIMCVLAVLLMLAGCSQTGNKDAAQQVDQGTYIVGMWLSYTEVDKLLSGDFKEGFSDVLENCKRLGVTDVFVHVRAFCDAIYPSRLFPLRDTAKGKELDILETMISLCHASSMRFHAWINPYRVRTADENIDALDAASPVRVWLEDEDTENDANVCFSNGIYLDPSRAEVRRLVIDGVREILRNYAVDGIHFDDYFYPTAEPEFDAVSYNAYTSECEEPLELAEWRRASVNQIISGTYTAVKFFSNDLIFSVSPAASLRKNREELFADVAAWTANGCVDWIIPQLYFGFEYPENEFCFDTLLNEWKQLERADNVKLLIGLAAYKLSEPTAPDAAEWQNDAGLLAREVQMCRKQAEIGGYVYYSYTALFSDEEKNRQALERLLEGEREYVEKN